MWKRLLHEREKWESLSLLLHAREPSLVDTNCENALCLADSFGLSVSSRLLNCGKCT